MKRLFLIILFLICAGYFLTGYFNAPVKVSSSLKIQLKDEKLQKAFKKIVMNEKKLARTPASEMAVTPVETQEEKFIEESDKEQDEVEYDLNGDTWDSITAELTDVKLKIDFHLSRREFAEAEKLTKRMNFLEKKLHYLPERE